MKNRESTLGARWHFLCLVFFTLRVSVKILWYSLLRPLKIQRGNKILQDWAQGVLKRVQSQIQIWGGGYIVPGQAYVVMSNHISFLDIPCVVEAIPNGVRMVAKAELMRLPIFGRAMAKIGTVVISRQDRAQAIHSLATARPLFEKGVSIWIAPEGTRSKTGQLGPLKKGGFHLALDMNLPILPMFIQGTDTILPVGHLSCHLGQSLKIAIARPIPTQGLVKEHIPVLIERLEHTFTDLENSLSKPKKNSDKVPANKNTQETSTGTAS